MSEDAPRKRSRFDQAEPTPRSSRFDRRSRSPSGRKESRRSRSPVDRSAEDSPKPDNKAASSAAAAAAAKINAQIQAKKASGEFNDQAAKAATTPGSAKSPTSGGAKNDIYQQDGDYIKDIEVNDLRNRYTLTKGSTQKMIKEETGADVTTRGNYYPDKSMATAAQPPLYLHVTSTSREGLEQAIEKINDMMKQDLPNLVDERRFRRREPREEVERDEFGRRKWPEEKIPVDLEPIPGFNLRAQVVGQQGMYVKHIQGETRCRVQIKGRGSGFHERDTNMESDEPMYLHVSGPNLEDVQRGKELCEDLLTNVRERYQEHKARGPTRGPYGSRGGPQHGQDRHDGYDSQQRDSQSYDSYARNPMSPGSGADHGQAQYDQQHQPQTQDSYAQMAQWAEYYAQNPEADPYKDYGGFSAYMQNYYAQYYQQQGQQASDPQQQQQYGYGYSQGYDATTPTQTQNGYGQVPPPPGGAEPPPPPPPDDVPPPPPPAASPPGASGYNSVPPPPGL